MSVPASPSGSRASHEAAKASSPEASIPNAVLRYKFFTPHNRGFDLVWDFLGSRPDATFTDGILTAKASCGYERSRDLRLFVDGQQIGHHTELWERFAPLEPVFHLFWNTLESAATAWKQERALSKAREEAESRRQDEALCAKVLAAAASAIEARRAATPKSDAVEDESATRKGTPK